MKVVCFVFFLLISFFASSAFAGDGVYKSFFGNQQYNFTQDDEYSQYASLKCHMEEEDPTSDSSQEVEVCGPPVELKHCPSSLFGNCDDEEIRRVKAENAKRLGEWIQNASKTDPQLYRSRPDLFTDAKLDRLGFAKAKPFRSARAAYNTAGGHFNQSLATVQAVPGQVAGLQQDVQRHRVGLQVATQALSGSTGDEDQAALDRTYANATQHRQGRDRARTDIKRTKARAGRMPAQMDVVESDLKQRWKKLKDAYGNLMSVAHQEIIKKHPGFRNFSENRIAILAQTERGNEFSQLKKLIEDFQKKEASAMKALKSLDEQRFNMKLLTSDLDNLQLQNDTVDMYTQLLGSTKGFNNTLLGKHINNQIKRSQATMCDNINQCIDGASSKRTGVTPVTRFGAINGGKLLKKLNQSLGEKDNTPIIPTTSR